MRKDSVLNDNIVEQIFLLYEQGYSSSMISKETGVKHGTVDHLIWAVRNAYSLSLPERYKTWNIKYKHVFNSDVVAKREKCKGYNCTKSIWTDEFVDRLMTLRKSSMHPIKIQKELGISAVQYRKFFYKLYHAERYAIRYQRWHEKYKDLLILWKRDD